MTNEGQLPMMKNMLNSAKKAGFPMHLFHCYILNNQKESAKYFTKEFHSLTLKKIELILQNMKLDKEILWIDNDIVLFQNIIQDVRKYAGQFVMQDDLWGFCTGFFLVRSSPISKMLLQRTIDRLRTISDIRLNDQHVFNEESIKVRKSTFGFIMQKLPQDEYPNGEVYFNQRRTSNAKIVHCNYLHTSFEKVQRFKEHGMWNESDDGFNCVNRYSI